MAVRIGDHILKRVESQFPVAFGFDSSDYKITVVSYDDDYTLEAVSTEPTFLAEELTAGFVYEFSVESRNTYGYSLPSDNLILLSAYKPAAPIDVQTIIEGDSFKVQWNLDTDNGSPITSYRVFIRQSDETTYTEFDIGGSSSEIISNR